MARWLNENWFGLLLTLGFTGLGVWRLSAYRRSENQNLLAAVIGFTALAAALLVGALWAAGIPQLLLGNYTPRDADQGWKATQSITLTLGALGLVAASVITYHRQRTGQEQLEHDRTKFTTEQQRERERGHQERYAQGAQMLADTSPAVRIAGLNVITALGKEVPAGDELRQTCINLICAYLRDSSPTDTQIQAGRDRRSRHAARTRYQVVAAEACRLLPFLLEPTEEPGTDAEAVGLDLDLHDTHLHTINLDERTIGTATFDGTTFSGPTSFSGATFTGKARFNGATFAQDAWFIRTTLTGGATFTAATFAQGAYFTHATFNAPFPFLWSVSFSGTTFIGDTRLDRATFSANVSFNGTTFTGNSSFDGVT